jgi:hypothetical protein
MGDLLERLAELEHQQWMHWAQALLASEPGLSSVRAASWRREFVPYRDLPEDRKDLDRAWARRALGLLHPGALP